MVDWTDDYLDAQSVERKVYWWVFWKAVQWGVRKVV
jgi:hypothetical protein